MGQASRRAPRHGTIRVTRPTLRRQPVQPLDFDYEGVITGDEDARRSLKLAAIRNPSPICSTLRAGSDNGLMTIASQRIAYQSSQGMKVFASARRCVHSVTLAAANGDEFDFNWISRIPAPSSRPLSRAFTAAWQLRSISPSATSLGNQSPNAARVRLLHRQLRRA